MSGVTLNKWKIENTAPVEQGDDEGWTDMLKTYKVG